MVTFNQMPPMYRFKGAGDPPIYYEVDEKRNVLFTADPTIRSIKVWREHSTLVMTGKDFTLALTVRDHDLVVNPVLLAFWDIMKIELKDEGGE